MGEKDLIITSELASVVDDVRARRYQPLRAQLNQPI